jgi:hypothetical protein
MNFWTNLSDVQKGTIFLIGGIVLLLNTLGVLTCWLRTLIIIGAIVMIIQGFLMTGYHKKLMDIFNKQK